LVKVRFSVAKTTEYVFGSYRQFLLFSATLCNYNLTDFIFIVFTLYAKFEIIVV